MSGEMMSDLQWMRARHWAIAELERLAVARKNARDVSPYGAGYYDGQYLMLLRIRYRFFSTETERIENEKVRREMFG